MEQLNN